MAKRKRNYDDPLCHPDHPRPVTRRDFLSQGFITGTGIATAGGVLSLFSNPRDALAALSDDLDTAGCGIATAGAGKIPFICFDLAGGVNIANSNVLVGGEGGQMDTPRGESTMNPVGHKGRHRCQNPGDVHQDFPEGPESGPGIG